MFCQINSSSNALNVFIGFARFPELKRIIFLNNITRLVVVIAAQFASFEFFTGAQLISDTLYVTLLCCLKDFRRFEGTCCL